MAPSVLILGCGSIGERHLRCFQKTGRCRPAVSDINPALLEAVAGRYQVPAFPSLEAAFAAEAWDALVICTPAHTHLNLAREAAERGAALLIEKPLAASLEGVEEARDAIARGGRFTAVAYVMHLMTWFREARAMLNSGELGAPLHASITAGQHFPTFRPAYREIYYRNHATGGGAIQDALTHLANVMEWLVGPCTRVYCDAAHQALEGVDVEDTVNVVARHGGLLVSYAMNQFQAPNEITLTVNCTQGSLRSEAHAQRWGFLRHGETEWTWHSSGPHDRDDFFVAQAHAFLDGMEGKPTPLCTFDEALRTLQFNLAALRSARTGLPVNIP